jgi:ankyrin repeat protein
VVNGHSEGVKKLLQAGADPDRSGANYEPPLVVAARRGDLESLEALLAAGADKSIGDNTGRTALDWARQARRSRLITLLEAH